MAEQVSDKSIFVRKGKRIWSSCYLVPLSKPSEASTLPLSVCAHWHYQSRQRPQHFNWVFVLIDTIKAVRGFKTSFECLCPLTNAVANPPSYWGGRASKGRKLSTETGLPISDGKSFANRQPSVSTGWRWDVKSLVTRAKTFSRRRGVGCVNGERRHAYGAAFEQCRGASWTTQRVQTVTLSLMYSAVSFDVPNGAPRCRTSLTFCGDLRAGLLEHVIVASRRCSSLTSSHVFSALRWKQKLGPIFVSPTTISREWCYLRHWHRQRTISACKGL